MTPTRLLTTTLAAALLVAPNAHAQLSADSPVPAVVGSALSVSVADQPNGMSLVPGATATDTAVLTINSTTGWTLLAKDASWLGDSTLGTMDQVVCGTGVPIPGGRSLASKLSVQATGETVKELAATNTALASGTGNASKTVTLSQVVGEGEGVSSSECYSLTVTYTVQSTA